MKLLTLFFLLLSFSLYLFNFIGKRKNKCLLNLKILKFSLKPFHNPSKVSSYRNYAFFCPKLPCTDQKSTAILYKSPIFNQVITFICKKKVMPSGFSYDHNGLGYWQHVGNSGRFNHSVGAFSNGRSHGVGYRAESSCALI